MSPDEARCGPCSPREWIGRAENDLRLESLGVSDEAGLLVQVCFHAQQAAEKAIKAALLRRKSAIYII
jgi:HEPN domain-containing protein